MISSPSPCCEVKGCFNSRCSVRGETMPTCVAHTVPSLAAVGQRCGMPTCPNEATDERRWMGLCADHLAVARRFPDSSNGLGDRPERKHAHYYKQCPFSEVDVYRVLLMFEVNDPCLQHAIKKLLCAGGRGAKDSKKDVSEAIDTLVRWQDMRSEEAGRT